MDILGDMQFAIFPFASLSVGGQLLKYKSFSLGRKFFSLIVDPILIGGSSYNQASKKLLKSPFEKWTDNHKGVSISHKTIPAFIYNYQTWVDSGLKTLRILHEWLFHMKFLKQAFGKFHKFHMK